MGDSGNGMRTEWERRADWIVDNYGPDGQVIAQALEKAFNEGVAYGRKYRIDNPQNEDGGGS